MVAVILTVCNAHGSDESSGATIAIAAKLQFASEILNPVTGNINSTSGGTLLSINQHTPLAHT